MRAAGLTPMKKVEIVVPSDVVPAVRDLLDSRASGYTQIAPVSGRGHHGFHEGKVLFNDLAGHTMIVTVIDAERVEAVLAGLVPMLERESGVVWVSDVAVSRATYFAPVPA
ncbi:hypothetical protein WPS_27200 [Vulcanimicrobium alpinum]|uniref:Uncharacterized protein n=1 Tax=Vulcanimicrobium alpinum TaxID=3016050 RepID=A0AAN1XY08_UNVUL|nr:hypothetical protein [Vulcanimicrobium alpinum]BDE07444.1 hypothetical protein WPS_27200 [Vulcanimicrobium alpinum]